MGTVPQPYFSFIMDYAPYFYVIPGTGVDTEWGRGPAPAAHAIDFLTEAHQTSQFEDQQTAIYNKIVDLANYLVSIQCTDNQKLAKILRILGFLTQTKAYLLWKKPNTNVNQ